MFLLSLQDTMHISGAAISFPGNNTINITADGVSHYDHLGMFRLDAEGKIKNIYSNETLYDAKTSKNPTFMNRVRVTPIDNGFSYIQL